MQVTSGILKKNVSKYPSWHLGMPDCHMDISMNILIVAWMHFNSRKFGQETFQGPEDENDSNCREKYSSKSETFANREEYMDLWALFYKICCFYQVCCFKDLFLLAK